MPNIKSTRKTVQLKTETVAEASVETKRDRFIRIGNARMQRALNSIRLLGNLANSNYSWNEEDIKTMQNSIVDTLNKTINCFSKRKTKAPEFTFENATDL